MFGGVEVILDADIVCVCCTEKQSRLNKHLYRQTIIQSKANNDLCLSYRDLLRQSDPRVETRKLSNLAMVGMYLPLDYACLHGCRTSYFMSVHMCPRHH